MFTIMGHYPQVWNGGTVTASIAVQDLISFGS
jgi:hypothetical protein